MGDTEDKILSVESSGDETGEEDRISKLPESLLCQILSNLPTRDSVRTSVLSTRWKNLWRWVPALDLGSKAFSDYSVFVRFVDMFLDFQSQSYLHKCCLRHDDCEFDHTDIKHDTSRLESWVTEVVKRKIQHLEVQSCLENPLKGDYIEMPLAFYSCENLARVELYHVALKTPEVVSLPCLKSLVLIWVHFANNLTMEMLISGCPLLEGLVISRKPDDNLEVLHVCSQTLRMFCLDDDELCVLEGHEIVINAPQLSYLRLSDLVFKSIVVNNLGSLAVVDVNADFNVPYRCGLDSNDWPKRDMIRGFFVGVSSAKQLIISQSTLEVMYRFSELETLPRFHFLSRLDAKFDVPSLEKLTPLLERCPNLKSVFLRFLPFAKEEIRFSSTPSCFMSSVEEVYIKGVMRADAKGLMEIVRYVLENSQGLKKLALLLVSNVIDAKEASFVLDELRAFPRRSAACRLAVKARPLRNDDDDDDDDDGDVDDDDFEM